MNLTDLEKFYQDDAYCGFTKDLNISRYDEYASYVQKYCKGSVHEIGSGLGLAAIALKKAGVNIIATDIFPQNANKTFEDFKLDIPVEFLNVNSINKADCSVDNYCLHQVMEHIENPEIAVKEIYRTLKPNGLFVLIGPNLISPFSSLKCLIMAVIGKWKTPWFNRTDNYSFPMGDTIFEISVLFFRNSLLSFLKFFFKSHRSIIFRKPCLQKPAISDSDSVNLLNPYDMRELFENVGFEIIGFQDKRKLGTFAGSTWIVGRKK